MTGDDQSKIILKTEEQLDTYKNQNKEKIIITNSDKIKEYPYRSTKLQPPPINPEVFGFNDRFFGGNVYKIARVYNSPWHLLVNKYETTIALFVPGNLIKELKYEEIKWLLEKFKFTYAHNISKADGVKLLTERFE